MIDSTKQEGKELTNNSQIHFPRFHRRKMLTESYLKIPDKIVKL